MDAGPTSGGQQGDGRPIRTAEILSIGSELTFGETTDTNAAELARSLTDLGVRVGRITALPDELSVVVQGFGAALSRVDLVLSTGGLGPTPDDLTREAIAETCGETPETDPELEAWLRSLWARRGLPFLDINLKQAWLIPSSAAIPNPNGTAPGWFVERPDGRVIVALPGPPREMRPMWNDWVVPRLRGRGLGMDHLTRTYRTVGIGESQVAESLGEALLRATNPLVATYARADGVDVRLSAIGEPPLDGVSARSAGEVLEEAETIVLDVLRPYIWGREDETWAGAIDRRLGALGWTLATAEFGTGGTVVALLGEMTSLVRADVHRGGDRGTRRQGNRGRDRQLDEEALRLREEAGADVALAVRVSERGADTGVHVAIAVGDTIQRENRIAFWGGRPGRHRAAITAASVLFERLGHVDAEGQERSGRHEGTTNMAAGAEVAR